MHWARASPLWKRKSEPQVSGVAAGLLPSKPLRARGGCALGVDVTSVQKEAPSVEPAHVLPVTPQVSMSDRGQETPGL